MSAALRSRRSGAPVGPDGPVAAFRSIFPQWERWTRLASASVRSAGPRKRIRNHAMRKGLLAALTMLLLSQGPGRAQENGPSLAPPFPGLTPAPAKQPGDSAIESVSPESPSWDSPQPSGVFEAEPVPLEPYGSPDLQGPAPGFFGSAEYLMWWFRNDRVPPLLTGGGVPGSAGYQVFVDNLDFADRFRSGGRVTFGYRFESVPLLGVEANYFFFAG